MKKFTLFFVATLFSALSFAALNPFAYGLSSSLDGTTLKVNYSLNADATGVSIVILDGETEVHTLACDGKTKGNHSVDISTLGLPTGKSLTWKVVVNGNSVASPTIDSNLTLKYCLPRGIGIDRVPESPYFGRIYTTDATGGASYHASEGKGLYVFDAALNPILNSTGGKKFTGGITFGSDDISRVVVSGDGRVFLSRFSPTDVSPVVEVNPADLNENFKDVFTSIKGKTIGIDVKGAGENLKLVMLATADRTITEYDLGTATQWTSSTPSRTYTKTDKTTGKALSLVTDHAYISYDLTDGVWLTQHRATATTTEPTIAHVIPSGVDYNNFNASLSHNNTSNGGIAISPDGTMLAVVGAGTKKLTIYTVSRDGGNISLTSKHTISTSGSNHTALAWDYAGNLYVANRSAETITFYAMPYSGTVATPCASKYAFELEEVVANVYTLTTDVVGEGTIEGNAGSYVEGTTATLTATPAEHYDFVNWTYGSETSTDNPLTVTVNSDLTVTANFQEHTKYTITASSANIAMGYVTGGGTYYAGETVTLKAVVNSTYYFVNWSDGNADATRTFTATTDVTLTANFAKASPRAWAYDLKMVEDGDKYKFSFNATTAANATLLFLDKEGDELYTAHDMGAVAAGANTVSIDKAYFTQVKDVYWAVKMDGEAITAVAEITDPARGIYDFYNMQGVVVDRDPNSEYFGKIYIQGSINGASDGATDRSDTQKAGLFIYDQNLNELNPTSNVGIAPTVPSGFDFGAIYQFHRLAVDPTTNNLVYCSAVTSKPGIFSMDRANLTGTPTNLIGGITGFTRTVAHCFDAEGTLYVMDIASSKGTIYKVKDGVKTAMTTATGLFVNQYISMAADGRGGLWVSHNRGQIDGCYQLAHVTSAGAIDWYVNQNSTHGFTGGAVRGALAYDAERHILAQGRNSTVEVFQVAYDATTGVPTLTKIATTPQVNKANIDALAFDYAGDLYVCNSGTEKFYKYTLPTADNICTVPAPKSQIIKFIPQYSVTVNTNGNGTTTGAGEYDENTTITLTATPAENHRFVNWTKGAEVVSTETTYTFTVTEDITLTANFEVIPQYAITVETSDADKGSVTGGGTYYEGAEVSIKATAVGGYMFEKWNDDNTDNPRTITVSEAATYTAIFKLAPARVFAYNLDVVDNGDETFTFSFIPNTNALSGRLIIYNGDTKAQIHEEAISGTIAKGVKSEVTISRSLLPEQGSVTWAVELTGEPVEKVTLLTKANDKANYGFNRPQGVAIDNNPASDFFGRMYIALPKAGGSGYSDTDYGIVVMDPVHNRLKSGVIANGDAWGDNGRYSMHRVAVNPTNGHVYYVRTADNSEGVTGTAIYELTPDATNILTDGGAAKNVISGASDITNANSVCFEEDGTMYVVANANYTNEAGSTGRVYKVVDGTATLVTPNSIKLASKANSIVSDGRGGFWLAQHRNNFDTFSHLIHINESGAADYTIDKNSTDASLLPVQTFTSSGTTYTNASYRGQVAYYAIDENNGLVAYGGGAKVSIFKATYNGSGVPSLTAWKTISMVSQSSTAAINVDGIAFDYAGNIVILSATDERMYQYALPLESENTSLVPSPTSKTIKLGTLYNVELAVNDNAMGTATGAGEFLAGETATVTATANPGYRFVNWTYGSETSTANPLSIVVAGNITVTANFEPLPEIAYELNGGQWNQYGWTSKKDMYNALLDDWRAHSGSTRTNVAYEAQLGLGKSKDGIPTTITSADDRVALMELFTDATYAPKWGWLATYVDAVAVAQSKATQPTTSAAHLTYALGNFFGEDNANSTNWMGAVDFTGAEAQPEAFQPTWGQALPMPTHPTTEMVLPDPVREDYEFAGWYAAADFSGAEVTTIDQNTNGTLYAKWTQNLYTRPVTGGEYGTICLPYAANKYAGAEFYEIAYLELANDGETPKTIWLDEVEGALEAGKPYIFRATSSQIRVICVGDEVLSPVEGKAGLTGTFTGITDESVLEGNYMIAQNKFWLCGTGCWLNANRAYIDKTELHNNTTPVSPMPGRRRVSMNTASENTATAVNNITEGASMTAIQKGTYDVLGRKLAEPTGTGFYIIDGKKVFVIK